MRLLVIGGNGLLGRDVVAAFRRGPAPDTVVTAGRSGGDLALDITDDASLDAALDESAPDAVVNCAGWTDVDGAEARADEAYRANAWGAWNVAHQCAGRGIPLCHVSTDFVFDGAKGRPYDEFDAPNPVNAYGRGKWAGEQAVQWVGPCWIVRTQWLFGTGGRNFAATMLRLAAERESINVVDDQRGAPSYSKDVAAMIRTIMEECPPGVYHANNAGEATWFEFAHAVLVCAGKDPDIVRPIPAREYPTPARRPSDSRLDRRSLRMQGKDTARHWRDALDDFMKEFLVPSP